MVDPLETRRALKALGDAVTELETQVADALVHGRELAAQNRSLQIIANDAQSKLAGAQRCCNEKTEKVNELEPQVKDLTRRLGEEQARNNNLALEVEKLQDKADKHDTLAGGALKLLEAFDRLPMKPEQGHKIPSDVQQDIELYGTYEWKAVADAKLTLEKLV